MHEATPLLSPPGIEQAIVPAIQERMCVRPMRKNFWLMQYFPAKEAWAGEIQQTSQGPLEPEDQTWQRQHTDQCQMIQWQRWHHHCFGIMLQHKWPVHMGSLLACHQRVPPLPRRVGTIWKISLSHRLQQ